MKDALQYYKMTKIFSCPAEHHNIYNETFSSRLSSPDLVTTPSKLNQFVSAQSEYSKDLAVASMMVFFTLRLRLAQTLDRRTLELQYLGARILIFVLSFESGSLVI